MTITTFDALTRRAAGAISRRGLLRLFGGVSLASVLVDPALALAGQGGKKKRKKGNGGKRLCRADGRRCKKKGTSCTARFCLKTPFTIEALWDNENSDHDTYLFVPNKAGSLDPSPFIDFRCDDDDTNGGAFYPFAFVTRPVDGPNEITTIRQVLPGAYEFWIELFNSAPAADLTVNLRNANGAVLRSWTSPANPSATVQRGWHVFDFDGATLRFTSVDQLDEAPPLTIHAPVTSVCPG